MLSSVLWHRRGFDHDYRLPSFRGIGIDKTNAGIPASRILAWYRTKKMPVCVSLVRYWTCSAIVSFFQSGTGLTRCRTVRHSGISIYMYVAIDMDMQHWHGHATLTWTCNMDMDTQFGHIHAAWTCTRSTALFIQHVSGQWTCMDAGMPIKSSVRHR